MLKNKKILIIIPARGGSKGIKLKNFAGNGICKTNAKESFYLPQKLILKWQNKV